MILKKNDNNAMPRSSIIQEFLNLNIEKLTSLSVLKQHENLFGLIISRLVN